MKQPIPQVGRVPASAGADEILNVYHRDGGVIIQQLLSAQQVAAFNGEVESSLQQLAPGTEHGSESQKIFYGNNTKRLTGIANYSRTFREEILDHDLLHEITQKTLSKGCDFPTYWLNSAQVIMIGPGSPAQPLHQDFYGPFVPRAGGNQEMVNNILIALTDYKEEHGATRVIPGSHLWEDPENFGTPEQTVPAEMSPGDALLICGSVRHGGGENKTTDFYRRALSFSFCNNALTPEEAVCRMVPVETARTVSKRAQLMLACRSQPLANGQKNFLADFKELADWLGLDK